MEERTIYNLQNEDGLKPQECIKHSPIYAKIVAFRPILQKLVLEEEMGELQDLLAYQDINNISPSEVQDRLKKMVNNNILVEFDKYFGIEVYYGSI